MTFFNSAKIAISIYIWDISSHEIFEISLSATFACPGLFSLKIFKKEENMKIVVDKANSRGYANHGWLKTHHTFSFANYYNPQRVHFGKLRVLNDDTLAPGEGFDMHPHKNMEVISIPLKGYLRHGDSIKNSEVITPGDIQVMSAGTGIVHSEFNDSGEESLDFLQIWVFPRKENTPPLYKSYDIRPVLEKNKVTYIIAPDGEAPASINQDAWFSLGTLDAGQVIEYKLHHPDHGVYLFVIEGEVEVSNTSLSKRDGAGFWETDAITIEVLKPAKVLLMDVPMH